MDAAFSLDTWKLQWVAFLSAPYIIIPFIVVAGGIGWWLRGLKSERRIDGLEGRIAVFEDRLKLAAEKVVSSNEARDDVIRQFQGYRAEVAGNAEYRMPTALMERLEAALEKLVAADNAVSSVVGVAARVSAASSMRVEMKAIESDEKRPK
jgi:hypothetical protein